MHCYRIIETLHRGDVLDGRSAAMSGGRWNARGQEAIYCAQTISLAILEMCCHYCSPFLSGDYMVATIAVPDGMIASVDTTSLPERWSAIEACTQRIGRSLMVDGALAIAVPSTVHAFERNIVLNPHHRDFPQVKLEALQPISVSPRIHG